MKIGRIFLIAAATAVWGVGPSMAEELTGRILGEKCAQQGKIGDCYLGWAQPMVLWSSETGDYYHIEIVEQQAPQAAGEECTAEDFCFQGETLNQVALDKSFAQGEARVEGEVTGDGKIRISRLELVNPPGEREFTKG